MGVRGCNEPKSVSSHQHGDTAHNQHTRVTGVYTSLHSLLCVRVCVGVCPRRFCVPRFGLLVGDTHTAIHRGATKDATDNHTPPHYSHPPSPHTRMSLSCVVWCSVCVRVRVCPSRSVSAPLDSTQLDLHCTRSLIRSGSHDGDHRGRRRDTHGRTSDKQKDRHSRTCSGTCRLCGLCVAGSFVVLRVAADRRRSLSELLQLQRSDELHPRRLTAATHLDRHARHAVMHVRVSPCLLLRCVRVVRLVSLISLRSPLRCFFLVDRSNRDR